MTCASSWSRAAEGQVGNFGSATFVVGSEMFFGKDRLRDVEAEIMTQHSGPRT